MFKLLISLLLISLTAMARSEQLPKEIIDNLTFKASNGETIEDFTLYDIIDSGKIVWIDFSMVYCGVCNDEALALNDSWRQFNGEDGPLFICTAMLDIDDWETLDGNGWRTKNGRELNYWLSTETELGQYHDQFNNTGYIPYNIIVGADYQILHRIAGFNIDYHSQMTEMIAGILGVDLTPPSSLTATQSNSDVTLNWEAKGSDLIANFSSKTIETVEDCSKEQNLIGYNIFRDDQIIGSVSADTFSFIDQDVPEGQHTYFVTGVLDSNILTNHSNEVEILIGNVEEGWLDYGAVWGGGLSFNGGASSYEAAVQFDLGYFFGSNDVVIKRIKSASGTAMSCTYKVVPFTTTPQEDVLGDLTGIIDLPGNYQEFEKSIDSNSGISGNIAVVMEVPLCSPENNVLQIAVTSELSEYSWIKSAENSVDWIKVNTVFDLAWNIQAYGISSSGVEFELLPGSTKLYQNYPNPFNPTTTIDFYNNMSGDVELGIYNLKGELVDIIIDSNMEAGNHSINFDGSHLESGVYFYRLTTPTKSITKRMILVK